MNFPCQAYSLMMFSVSLNASLGSKVIFTFKILILSSLNNYNPPDAKLGKKVNFPCQTYSSEGCLFYFSREVVSFDYLDTDTEFLIAEILAQIALCLHSF